MSNSWYINEEVKYLVANIIVLRVFIVLSEVQVRHIPARIKTLYYYFC